MGINTEAIFLMSNSNNKYYSSAFMKKNQKKLNIVILITCYDI